MEFWKKERSRIPKTKGDGRGIYRMVGWNRRERERERERELVYSRGEERA